MTDMQISSMNAMQSIICLADTLKELKTRCEVTLQLFLAR